MPAKRGMGTTRVTVTLDKGLVALLEQYRTEHGLSRSLALETALRRFLEQAQLVASESVLSPSKAPVTPTQPVIPPGRQPDQCKMCSSTNIKPTGAIYYCLKCNTAMLPVPC